MSKLVWSMTIDLDKVKCTFSNQNIWKAITFLRHPCANETLGYEKGFEKQKSLIKKCACYY